MMVFSYILDAILLGVAGWMFFTAKFGITRQMACVPFLTVVLDVPFVAQFDWALTPVLSLLAFAFQGVVLLSSAALVYEDRLQAKNKASRRQRRREALKTVAAFEAMSAETLRRREAKKLFCA